MSIHTGEKGEVSKHTGEKGDVTREKREVGVTNGGGLNRESTISPRVSERLFGNSSCLTEKDEGSKKPFTSHEWIESIR